VPHPAKRIPPARDRLQSRLLVWIGSAALIYWVSAKFWFYFRLYAAQHPANSPFGFLRGSYITWQGRYDGYFAEVIAVSLIFAFAAWQMRAATAAAAACGGLVCLLLTSTAEPTIPGITVVHSGLTPLLLLFVLTHQATRLGRQQKASAGLAESRKGRNAAQVIANLGIAALFASLFAWNIVRIFGWDGEFVGDEGPKMMAYFTIPYIPMLAALCEATADTVSSEIGQAFGGTPFILTTLRPVQPGTDGAISLKGTLAGAAAAAIVAASALPALGMSKSECSVAFAAGVAGLFFDSLLGATVERKGWLGNDLVNFSSTAFAAAIALLAIRFGQNYLLR
jgi:uncharacterized protein (TIGR00297 family)